MQSLGLTAETLAWRAVVKGGRKVSGWPQDCSGQVSMSQMKVTAKHNL